MGNITITTGTGTHRSRYFQCGQSSDGSTISDVSSGLAHPAATDKVGGRSDPSGNSNYFISWSSGSCNSDCTETDTSIGSTMEPNTAYWSVQDNVFGNAGICGTTINYQNVMEPGTSSNNYDNQWGIESFGFTYFCISTQPAPTIYSIMTGYNLNQIGVGFEQWFTLTNGHPTTAWLTVTADGGNVYNTYSSGMPSGTPTYSVVGWTLNIVCGSGGCTTTFSGGSGTIGYFQNNIKVSSPMTGSLKQTAEQSNCQYSSITTSSGSGSQTFSC